MHDLDLKELVRKTREVVTETATYVKELKGRFSKEDVQYKGESDLVSFVDIETEKRLKERLKEVLPEAGFIAEESESSYEEGRSHWIIDPIDGTTNFVHMGIIYCISVALRVNDEVVLGVVHEVEADNSYWAYRGGGAWKNDKQIGISQIDTLKEALVATGFPYTNFSRLEPFMQVFEYCMRNTHGIRRLGSAALDLAYVAEGRFETFYEYGLNAWDVAAGSLLVREAGGQVSDFSGKDNYLFGKEIVASNGTLHEPFMKVIKTHFQNTD